MNTIYFSKQCLTGFYYLKDNAVLFETERLMKMFSPSTETVKRRFRTVEPHYDEDLGTMRITLLYQG